ncbi:MAG: tetratricopeptide repeat protein [Bacteroidota bacterium]|nr:tetratricopeptide repeat protein [Bacteroidota bacterium]
MKNQTNIMFYVFLGIIPIGLLLKIQGFPGGPTLAAFGLLGLFIFFITKSINDYTNKRVSTRILFSQLLIILMIITIFCKYFFHRFWDLPALVIVPLFVFFSIVLVIKKELKDARLVITNILFSILIIPLFAFHFMKEPRKYIPIEWYDRYEGVKYQTVKTPYKFKYTQTKELDQRARRLNESGEYGMALKLYEEARKLESDNTDILFDMSDSYAQINNLEKAISLLDTAIIIDKSFAPFYNNRGLLYYKMNMNKKAIEDYNMAIKLNPDYPVFYANLALVYYYEHEFDKACEAIKKLRDLRFDYSDQKELLQIERIHCD